MGSQDSYLKSVFKEPPLTAYKRNKNLRSYLIRAKLPNKKPTYPKRYTKGMKKCGHDCPTCPYIREGREIMINKSKWKINRQFNCSSYNVVYAIICNKDNCNSVYIGETKRMLKYRIAEHRGYVLHKRTDKSTGEHFNLPGHSLADLRVTIVEQTKGKSSEYRNEREHYFIRRFDTLYGGLNRQK